MFRVHWSRMIGPVLSLAVLCAPVAAELSTVSLEHGFHLLYNLDFGAARDQFAEYQRQHADDPMGPMAEAAGLLFSELNRLGVLRARFFAEDSSFRSRSRPKADAVIHGRFDSALRRLLNPVSLAIRTTGTRYWPRMDFSPPTRSEAWLTCGWSESGPLSSSLRTHLAGQRRDP
jgi:hypothetical protein